MMEVLAGTGSSLLSITVMSNLAHSPVSYPDALSRVWRSFNGILSGTGRSGLISGTGLTTGGLVGTGFGSAFGGATGMDTGLGVLSLTIPWNVCISFHWVFKKLVNSLSRLSRYS